MQGRFDEARGLCERALDCYAQLGDRQGSSTTLVKLGLLSMQQERLGDARRVLEQALPILQEIRSARWQALALGYLAVVELLEGRVLPARELLQRTLKLQRQAGDRHNEAHTLHKIAEIERRAGGSLAEATALAWKGRDLLEQVSGALCVAECLCECGHLALASELQPDAPPPPHPTRWCLEQAEQLSAAEPPGSESVVGQALTRLRRAVQAAEAGAPLFRGEFVEDLPAGLRQWLVASGQLQTPPGK